MTFPPKVSVIIPAYNASRTIAATLDSVRAQTFSQFECWIVDDGSTDDTAAIAESYGEADPRFRLLRQPNRGVALARNAALERSQGEFVAALDADDVWHPDYLEAHVSALTECSPHVGFSYCFARAIDEHGWVKSTMQTHGISGRIGQALRYHNAVGNPSVVVFRRDHIMGAGGYDPRLQQRGSVGSEDWLLLMKVAATSEAAVIPLYLVGYRVLPDSMSADRMRMVKSSLLAEQIYMAELPEAATPERVGRWRSALWALERGRDAMRAGKIVRAAWALGRGALLDPARLFARLADMPVSIYRLSRRRDMRDWAQLRPDEDFFNHHQSRPFSSRLMKRRLQQLTSTTGPDPQRFRPSR